MIVCLDTETTGLYPGRAEILTLSVIDATTGEVLLDERYKPARAKTWPAAERVHHISPASVASCPPIADSVERIRELLASAELVVAYNADFDLGFLAAVGAVPEGLVVSDPMLDYADHHVRGGRWQRLEVVASRIGHVWSGAAHGSLADARATAEVWRWLEARGEATRRAWGA